jgi:hypothetical protein
LFRYRVLLSVLALAAAAPVQASITYYSTQSVFNGAITGLGSPQAISFDGNLGTFFDALSLDGFGLAGTGPNHAAGGELMVLNNPSGSWPPGDVLAHSLNGSNFAGGSIVITPTSGARAIAFSAGFPAGYDTLDIVATTQSGATAELNHYFGTLVPAFFGVVADEQIMSISITVGSQYNQYALSGIEFANMADTSSSGTPEPGSLALIGVGVVAIGLFRRGHNGRRVVADEGGSKPPIAG